MEELEFIPLNADLDSSERFLHALKPLRDLESNWTVNLAKNLEEYLLKICSGEISAEEVNFAEAGLLLQGSVQVYSRKVDYLHSLALHALYFISKESQEDQEASSSAPPDSTGKHNAQEEDDDAFWGLDDIPVDPNNLLDNATCGDVPSSHFVRPPANLVGDCLDTGGDAEELQSYLLASCDIYRDFILLDTCDAVAVDNFLDSRTGKGATNIYKASSVTSKGRKSFLCPSRPSGGTAQKLSSKKKNDSNLFESPCVDQRFESNDCYIGHSSPPPSCDFHADFHADGDDGFGTGDAYFDLGDLNDSDDDDAWKPLNPHAPGNLKVKSYKKVKAKTRLNVGSRKFQPLTAEFPLATIDSLISPELNEIWEAKSLAFEKRGRSDSLTLYEKLRQSLVIGEKKANDAFCNPDNNREDNEYEDNGYESADPDNGPSYFVMPDKTFNHEDVPPHEENENPHTHVNLEDLCRSHLEALVDTLAQNEKQTELAARVSTWKQRIEQDLEEQKARPPFDIHKYGDRVLDKLSMGKDGGNALSFSNVVKGQKKHDVARTFTALLQLVNNGYVDLVRSSPASTCHSDENPFHVRLLKNEKKRGILLQSAKRRANSPKVKAHAKVKSSKRNENCADGPNSPPQACSSICSTRCTPEGNKRRK